MSGELHGAPWCLRPGFESCRVCRAALLLPCEGILDLGRAQQLVRFCCSSGVAEAGAQPLGQLGSRAGLCRAGMQEVPAGWVWRRCCQALAAGLCGAGQGWVPVPAQEPLSSELQQCAGGTGGVLPGGPRSWCVSPARAEAALCWGMRVSQGQGAEGRRPPRPHVLAQFPPQPLTVPDRTVDVRLCTERRAGREGEEEAQARSSRAVRFKLTLCFVGGEVRRPGHQHTAAPLSFIPGCGQEQGLGAGASLPTAGAGASRCPGLCWAQPLETKVPGGTRRWQGSPCPQCAALSAFTSDPEEWVLGLSPGSWLCSAQTCAPAEPLQVSEPKFLLFNFLLLILSLLVLHTSFPSSFLLAVFHLP